MKDKQPLFSLTAADFKWSYTRGTGPGGQKKNKTNSAVHCKHEPSGAHGYAEDTRSQHDNKSLAFERMTNTKEFKQWLNLEIMRRVGILGEIERNVEREMQKVKLEVRQDGKWTEVDKNSQLDEGNQNEHS
jgi:protein subunit release factor A